jgi:hypothetical protein
MFNDGKDHLPEKLPLRNAEDILAKGPLDNEHIMAELRFGLRGLFLKALYYPNSELVSIVLEYLQLLQKTKTSLANYSVEDKILEEFKKQSDISDHRTLYSEEKEHILSMTRSAELSKITTALLMPTDENIDFCQKAYLHVGWTEEFLKQIHKQDVLEILEKKNLYPPKIKGLDNQIDIKPDLTLKSVSTENVRSLLDQLESESETGSIIDEKDTVVDENLSEEITEPIIHISKDVVTTEIKESTPAIFDYQVKTEQQILEITETKKLEQDEILMQNKKETTIIEEEDKEKTNDSEKKKDKSLLEKTKDIILNPGLPKWGKQHAVESTEDKDNLKKEKKTDELIFEKQIGF